MLCSCASSVRNFIVRTTNLKGLSCVANGHFKVAARDLYARTGGVSYHSGCRGFRGIFTMMVDSGASAEPGAVVNMLSEKERVGDGGYASGGWKSEDGKLSYGFSSFRGKRVSMEDFFDVKTTIIDGKPVSLFGIFDGHGGSRAAEYLKEHLFENLTKHPLFLNDTKLAISETYQKTDADFLEAERYTFRDDGSTASTAVLVGNHLYVANVGDSRAVVSVAGKAIPLSDDHKPKLLSLSLSLSPLAPYAIFRVLELRSERRFPETIPWIRLCGPPGLFSVPIVLGFGPPFRLHCGRSRFGLGLLPGMPAGDVISFELY